MRPPPPGALRSPTALLRHPGQFRGRRGATAQLVHNSDMLPEAAAPDDDPLEQDAPDHPVDDPAIVSGFLADGDRANRATDLRMFTTGNLAEPLIDGWNYFAMLCRELMAVQAKGEVYFLDFRGDLGERLDGPGSEIGAVLGQAARRGAGVFGLLWRSHPRHCGDPRRGPSSKQEILVGYR